MTPLSQILAGALVLSNVGWFLVMMDISIARTYHDESYRRLAESRDGLARTMVRTEAITRERLDWALRKREEWERQQEGDSVVTHEAEYVFAGERLVDVRFDWSTRLRTEK
ncbi:MAG: hypothetical protein AAGE52_26020 [Myxococcota bacterium]